MAQFRPEDIFEILNKECSFDECGVFTTNDLENFIAPLRDCAELANIDWTWDEGVSKLVLIFKELGFVIKIPYTGTIDEENKICPCDDCSRWSACTHNCTLKDEYEYRDNEYYEFSNADEGGKRLDRCWDYCEAETWYYSKALWYGVEVCFAETRFLGFIEGHPIYTQPLAAIFSSSYSSHTHHTDEEIISTKEACKRINGWCFNVSWLTDFLLYYGDEMFQKFMAFIKEYDIRDLHEGNVGYIDNIPVLVDYSGYND